MRSEIAAFLAEHWWRLPDSLSPWDERLIPLLARIADRAGVETIALLADILKVAGDHPSTALDEEAARLAAIPAPDGEAIREMIQTAREKGQNQPTRPRGVQPLRFRRRRERRRRLMNVAGYTDDDNGNTPPLTPEQIKAALKAIANLARQSGTKWALVGGTAMQRYGSPRYTFDIDIIADQPFDQEPHHMLAIGGYAYELETDTGVMDVDVIIREDDYRPLYVEALRKARLDPAGVPVITPEYMVAMKMAAGRGKDEDDLLWLIKNGKVDVPLARKIVGRLVGGQFAQREFDSLVMEASLRAQEEEPRDY